MAYDWVISIVGTLNSEPTPQFGSTPASKHSPRPALTRIGLKRVIRPQSTQKTPCSTARPCIPGKTTELCPQDQFETPTEAPTEAATQSSLPYDISMPL